MAPSDRSTISACHEALLLPELATAILEKLGPGDIITMYTVNDHFKRVTLDSPEIRRALFMEGTHRSPDAWTLIDNNQGPNQAVGLYILNDLVFQPAFPFSATSGVFDRLQFAIFRDREKRPLIEFPGGEEWLRSLHITRPAVQEVIFDFGESDRAVIRNSHGVKVGNVFDAFRSYVLDAPRSEGWTIDPLELNAAFAQMKVMPIHQLFDQYHRFSPDTFEGFDPERECISITNGIFATEEKEVQMKEDAKLFAQSGLTLRKSWGY